MTDEEKKCNCRCKELALKFLFLTSAIFLGTFLAILLSQAINKPKFPCHRGMMKYHPTIERRLPPPMMRGNDRINPEYAKFHHFQQESHKRDFNPDRTRPDLRQHNPQNIDANKK